MYNVKGGWKSERRLPPSFRLPSVQRRQTRKMKIFEACRQPLCILHNSGNPFISTDCASMYQRATHDSQPTRTSFSYVRYGRSTFLFFFFFALYNLVFACVCVIVVFFTSFVRLGTGTTAAKNTQNVF